MMFIMPVSIIILSIRPTLILSMQKETEQKVYDTYLDKKARVFSALKEELEESCTPYQDLTEEYQVYEVISLPCCMTIISL